MVGRSVCERVSGTIGFRFVVAASLAAPSWGCARHDAPGDPGPVIDTPTCDADSCAPDVISGPRLCFHPDALDFGGVVIGTEARMDLELTSCGGQPVVLTDVRLAADPQSAPARFVLVADRWPATGLPASDAPETALSLAPGQSAILGIVFRPVTQAALEPGTGLPVPDATTLHVAAEELGFGLRVPIVGNGTRLPCPVPRPEVVEGDPMPVATVVHLQAEASQGADGPVRS